MESLRCKYLELRKSQDNPDYAYKFKTIKSNINENFQENVKAAFKQAETVQGNNDTISLTTNIDLPSNTQDQVKGLFESDTDWINENFKRLEVQLYCEELNDIICYTVYRRPTGDTKKTTNRKIKIGIIRYKRYCNSELCISTHVKIMKDGNLKLPQAVTNIFDQLE